MNLSLSTLPAKAQIGIVGAIAAAGFGAFYYFYAQPLWDDMAVRQQTLATVEADVNRGLATARQLPAFRQQVSELEGRLEALRAVLPEEKDVSELLRRIQTLAMQSNLTIKAFKPAPMITRQMHAEWPIGLELEGTYHNLAMFFDRVGKFSRIINLSDVEIKARETGAGATIGITCVATTFVLLDPSKVKKPAAAAAATRAS